MKRKGSKVNYSVKVHAFYCTFLRLDWAWWELRGLIQRITEQLLLLKGRRQTWLIRDYFINIRKHQPLL